MTKQRGDKFLLQVDTSDNDTPVFTTVAGLRSTGISGKVKPIDVSNKDSGGVRQLLSGGGSQHFTISGAGVFDSGDAHKSVCNLFINKTIKKWQITRGDNSVMTMDCLITQLDYAGEYNGEETFSMTLESAGAITYTPVI